jgi:hypothetical protein
MFESYLHNDLKLRDFGLECENILPKKVLLHWEKPGLVLVIFQISPATQPES